ncbi:MAG: hypothetical protein UY56_C0004G0013 [Parcubacteria group bacterium GW2011_GWA1_50_14]|uniref:Uncharacterized protein n=1 Tax=Candidatus Liptonbacteria bacterium GWB1_49_6 TaxID=1798644 RepID=A0A1G2C5F6_9BACT|nr:MAG: hypothetical protein UY56_C0004G0013 [Parcubacteria group bacterium GW2011_GWA1_50_14]OGY96662.1 MAG: hypothetical protein A2122_00540 [Candidatus Liptonbacteria bacterium GWB1_49_6]
MDAVWGFCQIVSEWIATFYGWGLSSPMHYAMFAVATGAVCAGAFHYFERSNDPIEYTGSLIVGGIFWPLILPLLAVVAIVISAWLSAVWLFEKVLLRAEKRA